MMHDIASIASRFRIPGRFVSAARHGAGHINDTYLAHHDDDGRAVSTIVQRVNHEVFRQPVELMENVVRITEHLRAKLPADADARRVLRLIPTRADTWFIHDDDGNLWRAYRDIDRAHTSGTTNDPEVARDAAHAVGTFLAGLADLPGPRLHETIPGFHDTVGRYAALRRAIAEDPLGRLADARAEADFVLSRMHHAEEMRARIDAGGIPERVTHNDTKFDNVMIDDATGRALCVIDLDTVMPGHAPYDFGEMVRSATNPCRESDRDLDGVRMRMEIFEAVTRGFLAATRDVLTREEIDALVLGATLMCLENGVRFLEDHLRGDVYFRIRRPGQNLDRARVQFRMVASIEEQEGAMRGVIEAVVRG